MKIPCFRQSLKKQKPLVITIWAWSPLAFFELSSWSQQKLETYEVRHEQYLLVQFPLGLSIKLLGNLATNWILFGIILRYIKQEENSVPIQSIFSPHFTDKDIKTQGRNETCPKFHNSWGGKTKKQELGKPQLLL